MALEEAEVAPDSRGFMGERAKLEEERDSDCIPRRT